MQHISFPTDGNLSTIYQAIRKYIKVDLDVSAGLTDYEVPVPSNAYAVMIFNQADESTIDINEMGALPMVTITYFGMFINGIFKCVISSPPSDKNIVLAFIV